MSSFARLKPRASTSVLTVAAAATAGGTPPTTAGETPALQDGQGGIFGGVVELAGINLRGLGVLPFHGEANRLVQG